VTPPLDLPLAFWKLLLAIYAGEELSPNPDGVLTLTMPGIAEPVPFPSLPDSLDALEARGWLELGAAGATITPAGVYWLQRFVKANLKGLRLEDVRNQHTRAVSAG
jgi:hypothetical protein